MSQYYSYRGKGLRENGSKVSKYSFKMSIEAQIFFFFFTNHWMQSISKNTSNSINNAIGMYVCVHNLCKKICIIYVPLKSLKHD